MARLFFKPKLFHKALLLVIVPLVFELVFIGCLLGMLNQVEAEVRKEQHAKQVVESLNSLMHCVMDASKFVAAYIVVSKGEPPSLDAYRQAVAPIPGELTNLRLLLKGDSAALKNVEKLSAETNAAMTVLDEVFSQVESGDRLGGMRHLRDLRAAIVELSHELEGLRQESGNIAQASPAIQARERQQIKFILYAGMVLNIMLAISLAVYFNSGTTRRLSVLIDNTQRLAKGQPLLPSLDGGDEIAHLDTVFKEMALALELAHAKERAVIESMPVGLAITDHAGKIQMVNPTMRQMFHFQAEELNGQHISLLFPAAPAVAAEDFMADICRSASGRIDERQGRRQDGSLLPLEVSLTSFQALADEYFLFVMLDVSERKEIERLKQEFVSMISHDLRTPLTSIQVFLNMLSRGTFGAMSEFGQKKASMADRNATRLINLINDLLDVEKMESGQLSLSCQLNSVAYIIERSLEAVRGFAEKQGVSLWAAPGIEGEVFVDGDRLVQVMVNLLGNAVKFSPPGATVQVSVVESEQALEIRVKDEGRGVPRHLREAIFERFKQVDANDAAEKKGTGLGLAICKAIVEQHGGTIGVESQEGKGSTFWFRLPSAASAADKSLSGLAAQ